MLLHLQIGIGCHFRHQVNPVEGQVGKYWFHEGAQAFFDDFDHYMMVKAMCKLSCVVCDRKNEQRNGGSKGTGDFNSIEQLKIHLFHQHRLFMCSLCLEGRKIFISEQKLYNRAQLNQHVKTGDSVVDGSESERGGFMGHPDCEFCHNPFYGDNELYLHMSTEHFTCHICQRRHPGQYVYYSDYNNLEIHFRGEHFLCEDEACLAKKFIVFSAESEKKRHDAMEHGGRISRSKLNAALQIPTSFRYQRSAEQGRQDRVRGNRFNTSDSHISAATQDSLETFNAVRFLDNSSSAQTVNSCRETSEMGFTVNQFELLAPDPTRSLLEEFSFPPLPVAPKSSGRRARNSVGCSRNTMAARLRHKNNVKVINSSRASPAAINHTSMSANVSYLSRPTLDSGHSSSSSSPSDLWNKPSTKANAQSSCASSTQSRQSTATDLVSSMNLSSSSRFDSSAYRVGHISSSSNFVKKETFDKKISDSQIDKGTTSKHPKSKAEDVQSANKALVEKIRAALGFDEDKFAAFKIISVEYRQDVIETAEYLAYILQFGLEHLVLELALLCPNAQKQRELVEIHQYNTRRKDSNENGSSIDNCCPKNKKSSKKGKEKCEDSGNCSSGNAPMGKSGIVNPQVKHKPCLDKDGVSKDHSAKGKSKIVVDQQANLRISTEPRSSNNAQSANGSAMKNVGLGGGGNKPRKKTPKFLKNRLGETSADALPDNNLDVGLDDNKEKTYRKKHPPETLPVNGVWRNGGGRKLVAMSQRG
ncbi:uncharacterized protein LOC126673142 isoform X2 [Mercurialis annua]|uniref:uncharacterized protein LOC126673142 isoform X2 n=1 Tax=Mercurialis annua TaxID=3986 RepID=UPI002160AA7E|nr:uncharacterized protein LOC126673142 isoform X2 [Mercurialis annua]